MENAHLWLQVGAEQESAMKNPLKKLLPKNDGTGAVGKIILLMQPQYIRCTQCDFLL